jgi:dTDP-4-amino-4,6-dideoxygalactose transaminase
MRMKRILPPAAGRLGLRELLRGLVALISGDRALAGATATLRADFDLEHVFLVSSGQAALALILRALRRLSDRREVLIPAYTCFSVPAAVERAGLSVKLVDVHPETFDFDEDALDRAFDSKTLCVVAHHLLGIPSDIGRVRRACEHAGAFLVEDAAQAMGGRSPDGPLGTLGDVGFFSLGRGKSVTAGSGGVILTRSPDIAAALAREYDQLEKPSAATGMAELARACAMYLFIRPWLYWIPAGLPFLRLGETHFDRAFPMRRLSPVNAGLLAGWRARVTRDNVIRARSSADFRAALGLPSAARSDIPYLRFPVLMASRGERDRAHGAAAIHGLGVSRMYPSPVNEIPEIRDRFAGQSFPAAKLIAERLLTLPTHSLVSDRDRRAICDLVTASQASSTPSTASVEVSSGAVS